MESTFKIPFYAKIALIFISLFAFTYTLFIGQTIIVPVLYATVIAILLNPLVNFLVRRKINRIVAISFAVTLTITFVLAVIYIISTQLSVLSETYPQFKVKFNAASGELVHWISEKFNIHKSEITAWTLETQDEALSNLSIGDNLIAVSEVLVITTLLPVYLFMILYYKPLLLEFIRKLFSTPHQEAVGEVLANTKKIVQTYLVGLFFEMVIVAVLNSAGLLLLGIPYAIILGITGAVLNIIPYIGGLVAIALPMIIAFITTDSLTYPILVFLVYIVIQFIDNNFIVPKIVASRVQINALISVIVVLIGGTLWGIPGMFLSIPLSAIVKVIFDNIDSLKPWGYLLGNVVPTGSRLSFPRKRTTSANKSIKTLNYEKEHQS